MLSISSFLGFESYFAHRVTSCVIGAGVVLVLGLVGRRLGGNRAGLIAAFLAAAYPNLWMIDGILFPEGLFALTIGLTLLAAYRLRDRPTPLSAVLLGVSITLATLTRGEAIVLVAFLTLPLIVLMGALTWRKRLELLLIAGLATAATMAPWTIRNLTTFREPIIVSSNGDAVLAFANCPEVYSGRYIGLWYTRCPRATRAVTSPRSRGRTGTWACATCGTMPTGCRWSSRRASGASGRSTARTRTLRLSTGELRPLLGGPGRALDLLGDAPARRVRRLAHLAPAGERSSRSSPSSSSSRSSRRRCTRRRGFALPADVVIVVLTGVAIDGLITRIRGGSFPSRVQAPPPAPEPVRDARNRGQRGRGHPSELSRSATSANDGSSRLMRSNSARARGRLPARSCRSASAYQSRR